MNSGVRVLRFRGKALGFKGEVQGIKNFEGILQRVKEVPGRLGKFWFWGQVLGFGVQGVGFRVLPLGKTPPRAHALFSSRISSTLKPPS